MSFKVNVAGVGNSIRNFPNGVHYATIEEPDYGMSRTNNPMIKFKLRLYHPSYGEAVINDNLSAAADFKVRPFWLAFNDWTEEEFKQHSPEGDIEITDVSILDNAEILVMLGEQESDKDGRVYKTIVSPFYFPVSRKELLDW